jgi:hypothetical protein
VQQVEEAVSHVHGSIVSVVCEEIFDKFSRLKTNTAKVQFFSAINSPNAQISAIIQNF